MPDLLAGSTVTGLDTPATQYDDDQTDVSVSGIAFVTGSPVVGVAFTAPTTGRVRIDWHSRFQPATANHMQVGFALRTGAIIGSGTLIQDGLNETCLEAPPVSGPSGRVQGAMFMILSGLTPGATYNAVTCHRMVVAGTGTAFSRSIGVTPCT
ncbi:hypothetical protein [Streptomyces sp. NBC_01506]|uniref:hypothetical protein n=1 Tax=Streptomyces sp. NBC_01506 TaxID=2903887 RepID=UPI003870DCB5